MNEAKLSRVIDQIIEDLKYNDYEKLEELIKWLPSQAVKDFLTE